MNIESIITAWINYCEAVLGEDWTVTRSELVTGKDAPRPDGSYITLKLSSGPGKKTIDDELVFNGKELGERNFNIKGERTFSLTLNSFRAGHNMAMSDLQICLEDPDLREKLYCAGIGITGVSQVLDITTPLQTGFEGRSAMEIFFSAINSKEVGVGLIEGAQVSGSTDSGNNNINTNQTINKGN